MLFRMQIPACSHGGSHFALGSKTNPSATPRGASERAEQTPTRAAKEAKSTAEPRPTEPMFEVVLPLEKRHRRTADGDGGARPSQAPRLLHAALAVSHRETTTRLGPVGGAGEAGRGEGAGVGAG